MTDLPDDWSAWRGQVDLGEYDRRWRRMAESGQNPHGEADFVMRYRPASVLDAGCGTGRVAIELARRGVRTLGVDADPDMVAVAREKAPELAWQHSDLAELDTGGNRFDVVVLAGNVVPYIAADRRAAAVAGCAAALAPGGRLAAGFTLRPDWPTPADFHSWCTTAGLAVEDRFASWDGDPFDPSGDYLLAVYAKIGEGS